MQSFCWWCGKKLQLPHFATEPDQLGHQQKVHKCCKADAEKEVRPVTAQPKPANAALRPRAEGESRLEGTVRGENPVKDEQ